MIKLRNILLGATIASYVLCSCGNNTDNEKGMPVDRRPKLLYPDLEGFKDDPIAKASGLVSVMYDFGSDSLIRLSDLSRDGKVDHMRVENCNPYQGSQPMHIYISKDLVPGAREDPYFTVVEPAFFDAFNRVINR
ncbi:MAG: hypothetical protein WCV90_03525 [Candidatus Woesearchaeota archaeon]|jgi:hypothetical protein